MNLRELIRQFDEWRRSGRPLVLATVVHTAGSTYAKTGELMLFDDRGGSTGLLSGGCLEPDLAEHARGVLRERKPRLVTYDMRDRDADELWGLGLGCDGAMQVLLQRLDGTNRFEPFAAIAAAAETHEHGVLVVDVGEACLGHSAFMTDDAIVEAGLGKAVIAHIDGIAAASPAPQRIVVDIDGQSRDLLIAPLRPPLRLLLLGAGPDTVPVLNFARQLGWYVSVCDHRERYLEQDAFAAADSKRYLAPTDLRVKLKLDRYDAAVIMSHHLASDRDYLNGLSTSAVPYIGLLGPPARRQRLLEDIDATPEFAARVHGPVGLDIGARGAEAIALSIVAGIYAWLCRG